MCSGSTDKVSSSAAAGSGSMEATSGTHKQEEGLCNSFSILLESSAVDDLTSFKLAVEGEGRDLDEPSLWYGRRIGSKRMGLEDRNPLMIAAMFGSKDVLTYILKTGRVDPNRACGSDGATALHCAAASGSCWSFEIVKLLVDAGADITCGDANGNRPVDVIAQFPSSSSRSRSKIMEILMNGEVSADQDSCVSSDQEFDQAVVTPRSKEYPVDPSLPDIKNGIYSTDEFRMYAFKVRPCSRAYSHDWTECPFVHPGENARRRDPRKHHYSCVPCPEFRKGSCVKGDACEYAHGIFECWLHPAQYRTRLCKDETNCARRVCFFAHRPEELRPLYASTGSAVPSPGSMSALGSPPSSPIGPGAAWPNHFNMATPPALQLSGSRLKTSLNARDMLELTGRSSPTMYNSPIAGEMFGSMGPYATAFSPSPPSAPSALSSRSAAFARRSQSFIDRGAASHQPGFSSPTTRPAHFSDWGSPNGKLDWGIQGEELNKLRKSASFGFRSSGNSAASIEARAVDSEQPCVSRGESEVIPPWLEQLYIEQQQMVA